VDGLIKKERLLVSLRGKRVDLGVLALFLGEQVGLAFLVDALYDKLILIVLTSSPDSDSGVFEDELRVAFGGEGSDDVELALGQFDHGFLAITAKE
jgi:hypothetical protein